MLRGTNSVFNSAVRRTLRYFLSAALCQPYILAAQALSQNIISGEMAAVCTKKKETGSDL
jgi:hypothetical protein